MKHSEIIQRWSFTEFLSERFSSTGNRKVGKIEVPFTNSEGLKDSFVLFSIAGTEVSVAEKCKNEIKSIEDLRAKESELAVLHCILSDEDPVTGELTNPKSSLIICKGREYNEMQEW